MLSQYNTNSDAKLYSAKKSPVFQTYHQDGGRFIEFYIASLFINSALVLEYTNFCAL